MLNAKQTKTFEQLDKMVEEIGDNDIPSVLSSYSFGVPPRIQTSSQSDGHINLAASNR